MFEGLLAHSLWKRGGFPVSGGLEDQPAKWVEMVFTVDEVYAVRDQKKLEKMKREAERQKRG